MKSSSCDVWERKSCRIAVSLPSFVAPRRMCCSVRGRWPTFENIMRRSTLSFTGRFSLRAAAAAIVDCGHGKSLPPKPEPMNREITRTFSIRNPQRLRHHGAMIHHALRALVERQIVVVPHATVPCISIGLWVSTGVEYVSSITTRAVERA